MLISRELPLNKTYFLSLSSHQLLVAQKLGLPGPSSTLANIEWFDLVQVLCRRSQVWWDHESSSHSVSHEDIFIAVLPDLWLLQYCCLPFLVGLWTLGNGVWKWVQFRVEHFRETSVFSLLRIQDHELQKRNVSDFCYTLNYYNVTKFQECELKEQQMSLLLDGIIRFCLCLNIYCLCLSSTRFTSVSVPHRSNGRVYKLGFMCKSLDFFFLLYFH